MLKIVVPVGALRRQFSRTIFGQFEYFVISLTSLLGRDFIVADIVIAEAWPEVDFSQQVAIGGEETILVVETRQQVLLVQIPGEVY